MKTPKIIIGLLLTLSSLNWLSAAGDAAKTLPPLVLKSSFTTEVENFKKSTVTTDLFKRYEFIARAIDGGGDFDASIKRLRDNQKADFAYWSDLATKEFKEPKEPKKPQASDKDGQKAYAVAKKAYDKKRADASLRFENQKAIANAYSTWLSEGVLPWINGLKPVEKTAPAK